MKHLAGDCSESSFASSIAKGTALGKASHRFLDAMTKLDHRLLHSRTIRQEAVNLSEYPFELSAEPRETLHEKEFAEEQDTEQIENTGHRSYAGLSAFFEETEKMVTARIESADMIRTHSN
jgi:predicted DNA binding CopG/RHH family protein